MNDTDQANPTETAVETDLAGRRLGDYQLLRRLGRGSMAEVYLAEQQSLRRKVAFKVLKSHLAIDHTYVKRFHHEAQAAASLVHANIVQIHEVGCIDGIHFIAQEYVEGKNLKQHIVSQGTIDAGLAVVIIRQVAAALYKAGKHGIVHRDIKPENIMLARTGEVKVADFGLARLTDGNAAVNLTQVGITMGTPLYMSPEQVEGRRLDPRSDIYSLGVTCYHMLAGVPPFRGDTALSVAVAHLKEQPDRLETHRGDLPAGLCRIVHKMLAKNAGQRYADARELLRDLRDLNIEGSDVDWPDDLGSVDLDEVDTLRLARTEATQQLQSLMSEDGGMQPPRFRAGRLFAVLTAAALLGGLAATSLREPFLLEGVDTRITGLDKQGTVEAQFLAAADIDTEAAWLSVAEHFPKEAYYIRRAKQNLARLYLNEDRWKEASQIFNELAYLPEQEAEFRAFGLAGQCVVLMLAGRYEESRQLYSSLQPLLDKLDPQMRKMVNSADTRNRRELAPASDIDKLIEIEEEFEEYLEWRRLNPEEKFEEYLEWRRLNPEVRQETD